MNPPNLSHSSLSRWIPCGLLVLALLLSLVIRGRLAPMPLERDEGEFGYLGQLVLQGVPPYKIAASMKLPGTFLAYAGIMAVFGQSATGIHLGILVVNLVTIVLIYRLTVSLFDPFAAGVAAIAYASMSVSVSVLGMAGHATHFVALFGTLGTWLLWRHLQSGRLILALASGFSFGVAFLMKQHGVFFMVFGMLTIVGREFAGEDRLFVRFILRSVLFGIGAISPYVMVCAWLFWAGVWPEFVFWTITYSRQYLGLAYDGGFWPVARSVIMSSLTLWLLASIGVVRMGLDRTLPRGGRWFVLGWLITSAACVVPGLLFRRHYFILVLPAVAMLAGVGASLLWNLVVVPAYWRKLRSNVQANEPPVDMAVVAEKKAGGFVMRWLVYLVLAAMIVYPVASQGKDFFMTSPKTMCRQAYGLNPFLECPIIAKYLHEHTDPSDTIAILGSEPEILFDARRNTCTAYLYTYSLVEQQPLARQMQEEMAQQIERGQPKYIVLVDIWTSWLVKNEERLIFERGGKYLAENYRLVGTVDMTRVPIEIRWEEDGAVRTPQSDMKILIYRRN